MLIRLMFAAVLMLAMGGAATAQNWPGFLGAEASAVGPEGTGLPAEWGAAKNIAWKVPLEGRAWSSPIIWGDRVFVTTAITDAPLEDAKPGLYFGGDREKPIDTAYEWQVRCYSLSDGSLLWQRVARRAVVETAKHLKNTYASETPVTDGQFVWAYFGSAGLYCFTVDGEPVWEKSMGVFETRFGWGTASSPIVDGDLLFIQADSDRQSFVTALNKTTGEEMWRADRAEGTNWSTPYVWESAVRKELVTCGTDKVRSYNPATGEVLWELGGMSSIAVPMAVGTKDLLYVSSGYVGDATNRPVFAIRPGASGDLTLERGEESNEWIAWYHRLAGPYMPSPLLYRDRLYVLYDRGIMACFDAATGREIYRARIQAGEFTVSPWAYDGKVFCMNESGTTFVIKAGDEFEIIGENQLEEMFMSSPALASGTLVLRGAEHLYGIQTAGRDVR